MFARVHPIAAEFGSSGYWAALQVAALQVAAFQVAALQNPYLPI